MLRYVLGLGLLCGITRGQLASESGSGGGVAVQLTAEGPGTVRFAVPRPHQVGQSVTLIAEPVVGASFVGWTDGETNAVRTVIVANEFPPFVARFVYPEFSSQPDYSSLKLQPVPAASRPALAASALPDGRLQLRFALPGRNGFRLLTTGQLGTGSRWVAQSFGRRPDEPAAIAEGFSDPGPVELWVTPPSRNAGFFAVQFDSQLTVPALLFADVVAAVRCPGRM